MDAYHYIEKIDLTKYLLSSGYVIDVHKSTSRQKVFEKDGEKLLVLRHQKTGKYIYQNLNDTRDKGNIINFVVNRINGYLSTDSKSKQDYAKAFAQLDDDSGGKELTQEIETFHEKVKFEYELYAPHELINYDFLLSRGLTKETINHPLFKGTIVNCYKYGFKTKSNYGPVMTGFPSIKDKTVVGLEIRDSNEKKMALGSEVVDSFWVSNYSKTHKTLVISENPIDNLSYCQIKGDFTSTHVATFGSISDKQCQKLFELVDQGIYKSIILINDNDFGGLKNDLKIISYFISKENLNVNFHNDKQLRIVYRNETFDIQSLYSFIWLINKVLISENLENKLIIEKSKFKDWNCQLTKYNI